MIKKIFIFPTNNTLIQAMRYFFVGGVAFVVDFSLLFLLTSKVGIHYLVSAAISFIFGLIINYFLSRVWVFNKAIIKNRLMEFGLVILISIVGLLLNELFIWFFTDKINIYYLLSKIIAAGIIFWWNFFARKFILYNLSQL